MGGYCPGEPGGSFLSLGDKNDEVFQCLAHFALRKGVQNGEGLLAVAVHGLPGIFQASAPPHESDDFLHFVVLLAVPLDEVYDVPAGGGIRLPQGVNEGGGSDARHPDCFQINSARENQ